MKRFIVTCCDWGDSADHKPQVLEVCKTLKQAEKCVKDDIERYTADIDDCDIDFDDMYVDVGGNCGCEWNIEEVEID